MLLLRHREPGSGPTWSKPARKTPKSTFVLARKKASLQRQRPRVRFSDEGDTASKKRSRSTLFSVHSVPYHVACPRKWGIV